MNNTYEVINMTEEDWTPFDDWDWDARYADMPESEEEWTDYDDVMTGNAYGPWFE